MNKQEFLAQLRKALSSLPPEDAEERLTFYSEMLDDRIEEGLSESEAVSAVGSVNAIAAQILAETPLTKLVKEKVKARRSPRVWEIVLIVLGSPIWLSLLIAALAIVLAVYVVIWSAAIVLWAIDMSLAACSLGSIAAAAFFAAQGHGLTGIAALSAVFCCAGLCIFLFFGCKAASKGILWLTQKIALGIKTLFAKKEAAK